MVTICAIVAVDALVGRPSRSPAFCRDRLLWEQHLAELRQEGEVAFRRLYRMKESSFFKLLSYIRPNLHSNEVMSELRTGGKGVITPELALHCLLRWLSGGSYLDIRLCAGMSASYFYHTIYRCIDAILQAKELQITFPTTQEEIAASAEEFLGCSSHNIMEGCVAALDGMLLRIQTPATKETGNVKSYFSGHYQDYGINVQAACDSKCRFIYVSLAAPGGANDIAAYRKTSLSRKVEKLPLGKYVVGDNAYVCTEHLLTPFPGEQKNETSHDTYNFYLSQVRIRIEMAFGRLVNKWRIFRRPLQVRLKNVGKVFLCASMLHNFCIDEGSSLDDDDESSPAATDLEGGEVTFVPSSVQVASVQGNSVMRDFLVEQIKSNALTRPAHNLRRNQPASTIVTL